MENFIFCAVVNGSKDVLDARYVRFLNNFERRIRILTTKKESKRKINPKQRK